MLSMLQVVIKYIIFASVCLMPTSSVWNLCCRKRKKCCKAGVNCPYKKRCIFVLFWQPIYCISYTMRTLIYSKPLYSVKLLLINVVTLLLQLTLYTLICIL